VSEVAPGLGQPGESIQIRIFDGDGKVQTTDKTDPPRGVGAVRHSIELSDDLQSWLRLAGLHFTQGSLTDDGRTLLWRNLGESRYFIGALDGWYVITCSDRMRPETYEFSADSLAVIEKYLFGTYGGIVRGCEDLARIKVPFRRDELRPEYSIGKQIFAGREHTP
jgi:Immunity protein 61